MDKNEMRELILGGLKNGGHLDIEHLDRKDVPCLQNQIEDELLTLLEMHKNAGFLAKSRGITYRPSLTLALV